MKKLKHAINYAFLVLLPATFTLSVQAASPQDTARSFVKKLNQEILFPLIYLLMAIAFLVFVYGSAKYIMSSGNDASQEEGRKHIMFGLIGLVVMVSAWAILNLAAGTFGLEFKTNP